MRIRIPGHGLRTTTVVLAAGLLAATPGVRAAAQVASPVAAGVTHVSDGTATFDEAWHAIRDTYVDEALTDADWSRLRDEFRPRAGAARTPDELRDVLRALLARIGRSHFELVPSAIHDRMAIEPGVALGSPGLEITPVAGEAVVWRVDPGGPAAVAGIKPGWIIDAIGPDDLRALTGSTGRVAAFRLWATTHALLRGSSGTTVRLRARDEAGRTRDSSWYA